MKTTEKIISEHGAFHVGNYNLEGQENYKKLAIENAVIMAELLDRANRIFESSLSRIRGRADVKPEEYHSHMMWLDHFRIFQNDGIRRIKSVDIEEIRDCMIGLLDLVNRLKPYCDFNENFQEVIHARDILIRTRKEKND